MVSELQRLVDSFGARLGRSIAVDDARLKLLAYNAHTGDVDDARIESVMHRGVSTALVAHAVAADPVLPLVAGGGALAKEMIRVNHYGADATRGAVLSSLAALGAVLADAGLPVDIEAARRAVSETWTSR
ncbi:hypothetical protein ACZ90_28720 [Streptomyces albus subsp. albus]|nr:hypothetical protein ACZ90_28720 [Streptomyces albus subsp. albus]